MIFEEIEKRMKRLKIYAFIDSQNLNLGTSKDIYKNKKLLYKGWKLDFKKFRQYLTDKFRVKKVFLFIGYLRQNEKLYRNLRSFGYKLIFKPTVKDNQGKPKGNIDAELVLYAAAIEYHHYDRAVIVSGDGDLFCLHNYLLKDRIAKMDKEEGGTDWQETRDFVVGKTKERVPQLGKFI